MARDFWPHEFESQRFTEFELSAPVLGNPRVHRSFGDVGENSAALLGRTSRRDESSPADSCLLAIQMEMMELRRQAEMFRLGYYNQRRRRATLGKISPAERERRAAA